MSCLSCFFFAQIFTSLESFFASLYLTTFSFFCFIFVTSTVAWTRRYFFAAEKRPAFFTRRTVFFWCVTYKHGLFKIYYCFFYFISCISWQKLWICWVFSFERRFNASIWRSDNSKTWFFLSVTSKKHNLKIQKEHQLVSFWLIFSFLFAISARGFPDDFVHVFYISKKNALAFLLMIKRVLGKGSANLDTFTG